MSLILEQNGLVSNSVKRGSGFGQILHFKTIVPFKDSHCLVPTNFHDGKVSNIGPADVGNSRVRKTMKSKAIDLSESADNFKSGLNRTH